MLRPENRQYITTGLVSSLYCSACTVHAGSTQYSTVLGPDSTGWRRHYSTGTRQYWDQTVLGPDSTGLGSTVVGTGRTVQGQAG